jgi:hypothetical protein
MTRVVAARTFRSDSMVEYVPQMRLWEGRGKVNPRYRGLGQRSEWHGFVSRQTSPAYNAKGDHATVGAVMGSSHIFGLVGNRHRA